MSRLRSALLAALLTSGTNAPAQDWPSVDQVLLRRQELCAEPRQRRHRLIELRRGDTSRAMRLELLLLASCAPSGQAALLPEALAGVRELDGWPPAYSALFELLEDGARVLARMERQHQRLQTDLDRTIRGISEIETGIDARDDRPDEEHRSTAE